MYMNKPVYNFKIKILTSGNQIASQIPPIHYAVTFFLIKTKYGCTDCSTTFKNDNSKYA